MKVGVLTISDRSARGERADAGGPLVEKIITEAGAHVMVTGIVPDDATEIADVLREWSGPDAVDLILTTGGTGLAPRDVTPEATRDVIDREVPGITELMRSVCAATTPLAALSRQVAGIANHTLIVNLPGSPKAAEECLRAVLEVLPHAVSMTKGHDHP